MRTKLVGALAVLLALPATAAAATPAAVSADAWQRVRATAAVPAGAKRLVKPVRFAAFTLDRRALDGVLRRAPGERSGRAGLVVSIPTPEGRLERFALTSAPVMTPGLAARHPEIRTYAGRSLTDRATTIRLSSTPLGLHASVRGPGRAYMVDPRFRGDARRHVAYRLSALPAPGYDFQERSLGESAPAPRAAADAAGDPVTLRTYRLALVTDPSYAANSGAADGLDSDAPGYAAALNSRVTAAKVVLMNRVNQLYERTSRSAWT